MTALALNHSARNTTTQLDVPLERIHTSPLNPRRTFDEESLQELAASIAQHGLLQPLVVRPTADFDGYSIIAGERRYRACKAAGLDTVPVIVREDIDETTHLQLAIVENLQRKDLDPIEEASGYRALHDTCGMTQSQIAAAVNRSQPAIANAMRLLELPEGVLEMVQKGTLSASHARALIAYAGYPAVCQEIARLAVDKGWTSKTLERSFDYEGIRRYEGNLPRLIADVRDITSQEATAAGLTVWGQGSWAVTPDVGRLAEVVEQTKAARKRDREAKLEAARQAARQPVPAPTEALASQEEPSTDTGTPPVPGRDPDTKNGRRRIRKDEERIARHEEAIAVSATAAALGIPRLDDLPYDSYEVVSSSYRSWPKACGPDCQCRAKAIDKSGTVVDISTKPRHVSALRAAEERAAKQKQREGLAPYRAKLTLAIDQAPANTLAAIIAAAIISSHSLGHDLDTTKVHDILKEKIGVGYVTGLGWADKKELDKLAGLDPQFVIRMLAKALLTGLLEQQITEAHSSPARSIRWFLGTAASSAAPQDPPAAEVAEAEHDPEIDAAMEDALITIVMPGRPLAQRQAAAQVLTEHAGEGELGPEDAELVAEYLAGRDPFAAPEENAACSHRRADGNEADRLICVECGADVGWVESLPSSAVVIHEDPPAEPEASGMALSEARKKAWSYLRKHGYSVTKSQTLEGTSSGALLGLVGNHTEAQGSWDWPAILDALTAGYEADRAALQEKITAAELAAAEVR